MNHRSKRFRANRTGATAVEFAIVAPLLFLFVLGIIDFSRANIIRNTAENACYEGARAGIVPGSTAEKIKTAVAEMLSDVRITNSVVTVTPSVLQETTPKVTVTIEVPLSRNLYASSPLLSSMTIRRSCTLSRENFAIEQVE